MSEDEPRAPDGGGAPLVGRAAERELIEALLNSARGGASRSVVLRGEPGVGKTALLEFAVSRADGMQVLRTAGVESESGLAFAGLYGLLRPVLVKLEFIPRLQADALAGALGLAPSTSSDRFLVSAGVLGLLAAVAEEQPLLCVIDDAQWLDQPSADALAFAARRLEADPVVMLFAAATIKDAPFIASGIDEHIVDRLDERDARRIIDAHPLRIPGHVRERILEEAAGNPLALVELPSALSEAELLGREPLPERMPLTPRLRGIFRRQVERLPSDTQQALLVAAIDGTGELALVLRAAGTLGLDLGALAPAEQLGLISASRDRISFRHPLVRATITEAASLAERQRIHAALAATLAGDEHADRRVWHQSMAAMVADDEVAAALELSGRRARERGGHASAAIAYARAADLTADVGVRAARLASAAESAWDAGERYRALALVEQALPAADDATQARVLQVKGRIEAAEGRLRASAQTLIDAADRSAATSQKLGIIVDALEPAMAAGLPEDVLVGLGERAAALDVDDPADRFNQLIVILFGHQSARRWHEASDTLATLKELGATLGDDAHALLWTRFATASVDGPGAGLTYVERAADVVRRQGKIGLLPAVLEALTADLLWNSQWERAYSAAGEGYALATDLGLSSVPHLLMLARVEQAWGRIDDARRRLDEVLTAEPNLHVAAAAGAVRGLIELGLGRPEKAVEALLPVAPRERLNTWASASVPDLVEAVVRANLPREEVEIPLQWLRTTGAFPSGWARAMVARSEALLGDRSFDDAYVIVCDLAQAVSPFERARTELLYGEWLRRQRRRKDARVHLRAAAEQFERLGAQLWRERAEVELRATGETARKRDPSTAGDLTPQELQISQLVADGHSNAEIAAQLFLSPRTVEYHLRKVFIKLGIASRTELIRHGVVADSQSATK